MVNENLRQKKVASLVKTEVGRHLVELYHDTPSVVVTITRVEMTKDLKTGYIYLSVLCPDSPEDILKDIQKKAGHLRKSIASKIKLKYNPLLIFSLDISQEYRDKLNRLFEQIKK